MRQGLKGDLRFDSVGGGQYIWGIQQSTGNKNEHKLLEKRTIHWYCFGKSFSYKWYIECFKIETFLKNCIHSQIYFSKYWYNCMWGMPNATFDVDWIWQFRLGSNSFHEYVFKSCRPTYKFNGKLNDLWNILAYRLIFN